ncbi:MAG TPA: ATP synthase F1 subunit epsilon [Bacteroidia bacterium]|jgi:F-type H+-transporting ATPase subunit epsilon|nr:ATP synthase F1 subunit epsilon [Bacteroidia bacterium]HLP34157.1 ATP synthase F1 subunit epsilon [Bacteroidia bacterium]
MQVDILTPDKVLFSGEATSVKLPGSLGQFEVLNNHAPLVSSLNAGNIRVRSAEGDQNFAIKGGVVEVTKNKIVVLA